MTGVLIKGGIWTQSGLHQGRCHEDEGRGGVVPVQAQECQAVPEIYQNLPAIYLSCGEAWTMLPYISQKEQSCDSSVLRLLPIRL